MRLRIVLLSFMCSLLASAQSPLECFVEFAGYDPQGKRLPLVEIASAGSIDERYMLVNITREFALEPLDRRPTISGNRLYFPRVMMGLGPIGVIVHAPNAGSGQKILSITACRQAESIFVGDVWPQTSEALFTKFTGRVTGCSLVGDWWVRSELLFGNTQPYESSIDAETGKFLILANGTARHLIVVGKGSNPVKAFTRFYKGHIDGVNLGLLDISDSCPREDRP